MSADRSKQSVTAADEEIRALVLDAFASDGEFSLLEKLRWVDQGYCASCGADDSGRTVPDRLCSSCGSSPWPRQIPRYLLMALDTLWLFWKAPLRHGLLLELRELKAAGKGLGEGDWKTVALGGHTFTVRPYGDSTGSPLLLTSPSIALKLNPDPLPGMPTVQAELRSEYLYQLGGDRAVEGVQRVVEDCTPDGVEVHPKALVPHVTRADIAFDYQGDPPSMADLDPPPDPNAPGMRTEADEIAFYKSRRARGFTGAAYGRKSSAVFARHYNKSVEIALQSQKDWFRKIWEKSPWYAPGEDVWRLEFQLKRKAITAQLIIDEKVPIPVETWPEFRASLKSIWRYLTGRWLVRRGPRTKKSRRVVEDRWRMFYDADVALLHGGCHEVIRRRLLKMGPNFVANNAGYQAAWLAWARWVTNNAELTLEESAVELQREVEDHCAKKETSVEERATIRLAGWMAQQEWMGVAPAKHQVSELPDEFHHLPPAEVWREASSRAYAERPDSAEELAKRIRRMNHRTKGTERDTEVVQRMGTGEIWARRKQGFT